MIKRRTFWLIALTFLLMNCSGKEESLFVEAENFSKKGGWVVDQQFMDIMGSSYLMAHGMGIPVPDAETEVTFPSKFFCEDRFICIYVIN